MGRISNDIYLLSKSSILHQKRYPVHKQFYTLLWLNEADSNARRSALQTFCIELNLRNVRVAAIADSHTTHNAQTLSHLRAMKRMESMPELRDCVNLVAEDTLSSSYMPYWLYTLQTVIENAPPDWGVLQLAYDGPPSIMTMSSAPFVPWTKHRSPGTLFYAVHPRGRKAIMDDMRAPKPARYSPDLPPEHLFEITPTYTYHMPLFCKHLNDYPPRARERQKALADAMVRHANDVHQTDIYKQERQMVRQILNLNLG